MRVPGARPRGPDAPGEGTPLRVQDRLSYHFPGRTGALADTRAQGKLRGWQEWLACSHPPSRPPLSCALGPWQSCWAQFLGHQGAELGRRSPNLVGPGTNQTGTPFAGAIVFNTHRPPLRFWLPSAGTCRFGPQASPFPSFNVVGASRGNIGHLLDFLSGGVLLWRMST